MLSTENRVKTIDGTFCCPKYRTVKHKESTNGYLRTQGHETLSDFFSDFARSGLWTGKQIPIRHTKCKLSVLQVRSKENTPNHKTQQFITAKISGCGLKQCSKTHSPLRQSSGVPSPNIWGLQKIWGAKMFDFRRISLFCMEKRLSKHKMTIFSKNLGGPWPLLLPPGYAYASEQLTTAKWGCANVLSNTSSGAQKMRGWTVWRTPRFARSNFAKLYKIWECAYSTQINVRLLVMYRSPGNFYSSFPSSLLRHYQMPECFYFNNCCFWARATVLSCYRNWYCSHCGQHLRCTVITDKTKTIVSDEVNSRGTQS